MGCGACGRIPHYAPDDEGELKVVREAEDGEAEERKHARLCRWGKKQRNIGRKARQLYLNNTFHTRGRLKVLHGEKSSYNKMKY